MGSSSSSEQTQLTEYNTDTLNSNIQENQGFAVGAVSKSNVTINTSDMGTVERAFNTTNNALTFAQKASENALEFAFNAGTPGAALSQKQIYVGGAVVGLSALAYILRNQKKGKK